MMVKPATDNVEEILNGFAEVMSRMMLDQHHRQIEELDLTLPQAQVLRVLRRGPIPTGQLATELGISASSVTQLTDRLIRKGLIKRQAAENDRRSVLVALSVKGRRLVDQFRKRRALLFKGALARLGEGEQAQVIGAMKMVVRALESYEQEKVEELSVLRLLKSEHLNNIPGVKEKMKMIKQKLVAIVATLAIAASAVVAAPTESNTHQHVTRQVRHELVTLPYYGVFDNLAYRVEGNTVTLFGQVVRPSTRQDAGRRVARIEGVERVVNQIEVLPLSTFDDSVRVRAYRTLFNTGGLYRYAMGANPSIHIVVNRGHLTLEGVVANEGDRRLANIVANGIAGVFSVTNNLRTEREMRAY